MNKGVTALNKNFTDWNKILENGDKSSTDYAKSLNEMNETLADLTGALSAADIPLKFFDRDTDSGKKHLELMSKAAKGDTKAIDQLGLELSKAQVEALKFSDVLTLYDNNIEHPTNTRVIVIHNILASDNEKFLNTPLKDSARLLLNILNAFILIFSFHCII